MKTRPLKWDDLKVTIGMYNGRIWRSTKGEIKVHASLVGCSYVMRTFWLMEYDEKNPVHQTMILMMIQRKLRQVIHQLKTYEAD